MPALDPQEVYNPVAGRVGLSSRTVDGRKRAGIHKVGEILEHTQADLLKLRNVGEKSLEELLARLQEKGLPIPEGAGEEEPPLADQEAETEAVLEAAGTDEE